jgi:hypothetical protein
VKTAASAFQIILELSVLAFVIYMGIRLERDDKMHVKLRMEPEVWTEGRRKVPDWWQLKGRASDLMRRLQLLTKEFRPKGTDKPRG